MKRLWRLDFAQDAAEENGLIGGLRWKESPRQGDGHAPARIASRRSPYHPWYSGGVYSGIDVLASTAVLGMPSVSELFCLARQCYAESNRMLNLDDKEALRSKGDDYMKRADELRWVEIIQGVFPGEKNSASP